MPVPALAPSWISCPHCAICARVPALLHVPCLPLHYRPESCRRLSLSLKHVRFGHNASTVPFQDDMCMREHGVRSCPGVSVIACCFVSAPAAGVFGALSQHYLCLQGGVIISHRMRLLPVHHCHFLPYNQPTTLPILSDKLGSRTQSQRQRSRSKQ